MKFLREDCCRLSSEKGTFLHAWKWNYYFSHHNRTIESTMIVDHPMWESNKELKVLIKKKAELQAVNLIHEDPT